LAQTIHSEGVDSNTKVIVLRSSGTGVFCSGASFEELSSISSEKEGLQFFTGFSKVINAIRKAPKFVIGRIHGKCIGGGVGIASAVDYAIAVEGADVKLSELAIGIGPFVVGPAVERKIGLSAFTQLSIDAHNWRSADWAKRKGLYAELHAEVEGMDDSIHRLSNHLTQSHPEAMKEMKKTFWKGCDHWDEFLVERASISGRLILSDYSRTALQKFKEKQKS
jgi:methylglutaconyl-CoA hydratase